SIESTNGGAESPGNTSTTKPVTAMMKPAIWSVFNRSPLCSPQRTSGAGPAPKKSKAPVPAERDSYANEKPAAYAKSAAAEIQLPYRIGEGREIMAGLELFSTKLVIVV